MSGIFFDLPSVRFLRRFRVLELMLQTIAAMLFRCLSAPGFASRRVRFRHDEAEFPLASQRRKFDWALDDSHAADGVPKLFGALRHFNNWKKLEDQHELLFIRKTLTPLARWGPTQRQSIEEAKRAVEELHDKEFLGRRLVVSGAKSDQHQTR